MPDDLRIENKVWNYELYIIGHVRYRAAEDARALFFCKRYSPDKQAFFDVKEYEHEE